MKTAFEIRTHHRSQLLEITPAVQSALHKMAAGDGLVTVYCPHTTAGLLINENADPSVARDLLAALERLVPRDQPHFTHAEGNSDAHIKSSLVGVSVQVPVDKGRLNLGTWQGVFFAEFDGPRSRRVEILFLPVAG